LFRQALAQRRSRVLKLACVIEDNRAQRQLAQSILRTEYDVICAADGQEGLQLYNAQAPDIVFLDIHLPLMDGISVLTHIRRHDEASRIVMFSQQSNPSVLKGAMQQGALGFVSKPFTADALIKYARKALAE
jgi:CheY-like chemotaxis protein